MRFVADNPGVWPFHCHVTWHFVMGMQVIFIESADQLPVPSPEIPVCGDVTPQMFAEKQKSTDATESPNTEDSDNNMVMLVFLIIGWVLFVLCLVLVVVLISKMKTAGKGRVTGVA